MTPYDNILYPSYSHAQTHPGNLAVIGRLFGLEPAPVRECRVLELGCGNGSNLIPMAWGLPKSRFTGIDLAEVPVRVGQGMAADLKLENVRLVAGNVMEIDSSWGEFDYILAHGLYSWVPPEIREQVMRICRNNLAPNGIAFVSYNAYPGAHLRQMIREMMLFHVRQTEAPEERLEQALALLSFLRQAHLGGRDEYAVWLDKELERAINLDRSHLFHDDLAGVNHPVYFHQFMANAASHGLLFLGEADFFEMSDHIFAPEIRQILQRTARDRLLREQYLDFLKCRRFRQTLLCRKEAQIRPEPDPGAISEFWISSKAKEGASSDENPSRSAVAFTTPKGAKVQTDSPLGAAVLRVLAENAPATIRFDEFLETATTRMKTAADGTEAEQFLLQLYSAGVLEFHTEPSAAARDAGEYPEASPVARWQVERGNTVTSLNHQTLHVEDEIGKQLIRLLDGTRDRARLREEMLRFIQTKGAMGQGSEAEVRDQIGEELERNLAKLAKIGLIVRR